MHATYFFIYRGILYSQNIVWWHDTWVSYEPTYFIDKVKCGSYEASVVYAYQLFFMWTKLWVSYCSPSITLVSEGKKAQERVESFNSIQPTVSVDDVHFSSNFKVENISKLMSNIFVSLVLMKLVDLWNLV